METGATFEGDEATTRWLRSFLAAEGGVAGTVHVQRDGELYLVAAHNIPPPVLAAVVHVARGKGMGGAAQVHKRPIQSCNLQNDESGNVRPGARAVAAAAGVALPVFDAAGEVRAIVGIAFAEQGEISAERERGLMDAAAAVPI